MATNCEQCGKPLTPKRKRFCCNKCKDRFHNLHNPRGYFSHLKDTVQRSDDTSWISNLLEMKRNTGRMVMLAEDGTEYLSDNNVGSNEDY